MLRHQSGQGPAIAWLTGLPGAGKTSVAAAAGRALSRHGRHVVVLDGDVLREGLCCDLGFDEDDRAENVRRAAEVARLMAQARLLVIVALISPSRAERLRARVIAGNLPFLEVFINTPLSVCEERDPKGLYKRARAGEILSFTGVSAFYEAPEAADLVLFTEGKSIELTAAPLVETLLQLSGDSRVSH